MPISLAWPNPSSERSPIWHEAHRCRRAGRRERRECHWHSAGTEPAPDEFAQTKAHAVIADDERAELGTLPDKELGQDGEHRKR
jgi:hypothetical protein